MRSPWIPSLEQVEAANRLQLAKWERFLIAGDEPEDTAILDRIDERFQAMGGWTPDIDDAAWGA